MSVNWLPPKKLNGVVINYRIEIDGVATYKNQLGKIVTDKFELHRDNIDASHSNFVRNQIPSNTNYTVREKKKIHLIN